MNSLEMLMTGFLGGCTGCLIVMWALQTYYKYTIREFLDAQYLLRKAYDIKMMSDDVKGLRMQVSALQSQFGVGD